MNSQRGSALILALLMLTFLMVLGGALLTSVTLDETIGDNYRSEMQLLYLAEAGIVEARNLLRDSPDTPSQLLAASAGADGVLSSSHDLDTLLNGTDDVPILNGGSRTTGRLQIDTSGGPAGRYFVFLRNDSVDGMTGLADSNQVLTLLSIAVIGNARKVLEVTVMKLRFPTPPASLALNGSPAVFTPSGPGGGISGVDTSAGGGDRNAIGVLTVADQSAVLAAIPTPPPADVAVIASMLDLRLGTPAGIERIADSIASHATDVWSPGWNGSTLLGNLGNSSDYRVVVVNGDGELAGTGYGILLLRGNLRFRGNFQWNGLILVIGQGTVGWSGSGSGIISGAVFVARTRADDRSAANDAGTLLAARGAVTVDFNGGGNSAQIVNPGAAELERAYQKLPFVPIAIREY